MVEIRQCRLSDREDIEDISSLIWEGEDYLSRVFDEWIDDGGFFVALRDGRVIGTAKITFLPGKVAWLEGLRVHPDYQGKGIGRELNDFILNYAIELRQSRVINAIEFATYYKNKESLHMAKKAGFKTVKSFYVLNRKREGLEKEPTIAILSIGDLMSYKGYISAGWKFVKKTEESFKWVVERNKDYSTGKYKFYTAGYEKTFILLNGSKEALREYIPCFNFLSKGADTYDIMFPEEWSAKLHLFKKNGFTFWEEPEEPNVVILRYYN